jgi:hypothetical protein
MLGPSHWLHEICLAKEFVTIFGLGKEHPPIGRSKPNHEKKNGIV